MYLSCLLIDVGNDPDRPRPGRHWLHNRYQVHQRLCMAFPSASKRSDDPEFLKPFNANDFPEAHASEPRQVHISRRPDAGFLFRVDPQPGGRVVIVVASAMNPDWDYAFHNANHLLAACPEVKPFDPRFAQEQTLRFRLVANPTRKIDTKSAPDGRRRHGKRVPVPADRLYDWLARKAELAGFSIDRESITVQPGYVYIKKDRDGEGQRLFAARYDGILKVTDPAKFQEAIVRGIGPGKAFGFGLLSVAPAAT